MSTSLFDADDQPEQAARLAPIVRKWADKGVYFGTSSWKYAGWMGQIYTEDLYLTKKKFSNAKFERSCINEYAKTFPVAGGDFSFYRFPTAESFKKQLGSASRLWFRFEVHGGDHGYSLAGEATSEQERPTNTSWMWRFSRSGS